MQRCRRFLRRRNTKQGSRTLFVVSGSSLMNGRRIIHEAAWKFGAGLRKAAGCAAADPGRAVCLSIGTGPQRESIPLAWDDDMKITELVRELNFGRYQNTENGGNTHD